MVMWENLLWFFLTLVLMGFFTGIEMAYYHVNRLVLEVNKKKGGRAQLIISKFIHHPAKFLGVTMMGYTVCLTLLGLQLSRVMHPLWIYIHIESEAIHSLLEITLTTFIVLIFAEFIPRAVFRANSHSLLKKLARIFNIFYTIFSPLASVFIDMAEWILKYVFTIRIIKDRESLKRSDMKNFFQPHFEDEREERNAQLMENAQELPRIKVRQCLVPRKEIVGVDSRSNMEDVRKKFIETKLSKLIVYERNIDHITGYIHQLDLFKNPLTIPSVLLPIPAVPESMSATDLIGKFTRERKSIAWVVDEFGGTAGIVTMEDVLEELFGEIQDEYDVEEFTEKKLSENEFIFSGRLELDYLRDKYGFYFEEEEAETLSGYIISYHETIPRQKERIIVGQYEFEIIQVTDTRIETVKMKKLS